MKTETTTLAIFALTCLLISCGQDSNKQVSLEPPPVGEPIETPLESPPTGKAVEVDGWKIVSSEIREFADKTDVELLTGGFNAVLGPRGSPIDLIINSMFHMGSPAGLLSWAQYEEIRDLAGVEEAYPIAVGYNYKGYRLVGTLPEMFEEHEWSKGKKYEVQVGGRIFTEGGKEALVGSHVARRLGLSKGYEFHPYHGLAFDEGSRQQDTYVVVGVLEPTGTPSDNAIWIPVKGIQQMEGGDAESSQFINAVLLSVTGRAGFTLNMKYNKQDGQVTLAWPATTNIKYFLSQTIPAYLSFARQFSEKGKGNAAGWNTDPPQANAAQATEDGSEIIEEGMVVKGKPRPLPEEQTEPQAPAISEQLPPLEEGSVYKPLAFRDLTNFEYLVEWEADGKDFDFSAYAKRVPSRLREKSGAKVAVEGFMIPTVVDENNKVKE
ncbi:MAG: ABC transporter permease, partial [Opitutae bacterium]